MRSPMMVWRRMNSHSASSSGAGLVEDRVGDGHLADVVQRGGVADVVDLLGVELQAPRDGLGQLGHAADVLAQLGVALGQRAQQHVAALVARRAAAAVLVGVHALVGDAQRLAGVVRPRRARAIAPNEQVMAKPSPCSVRARGAVGALRDGIRSDAEQHAELVAAHAVGRAGADDVLAELGSEALQQGVAGRVAVGVVVVLEAVEVEERQHGALALAARRRGRGRA